MKILASTNVKAVERLLTPSAGRDRKTSAAVATIVSAVRTRGDAALLAYAQRFDRLDGDLEVSRDEIEELAVRVPPKVRAAIAAAAQEHREGRPAPAAAGLDGDDGAGRHRRAARHAARSRRLLRSGRTVSTALFAADDRDSRASGGRPRDHRRLPASRAGRDGGCARSRCDEALQNGRRPGHCRPGVRHEDRSARRQDRRSRQSVRRRGEGAGRHRLRHRFLRRPDRDRHRLGQGQSRVDRGRSDRAGRARSAGARAADYHEPPARVEGCPRGSRADAENRTGQGIARAARRHHHRRQPRRSRSARESRGSRASRVRRRSVCERGWRGGRDFRRVVHGTGSGRLCDRLEPCAADQRRGAFPRRPAYCGFRARVDDSADDAARARDPGADRHHARARGRARGTRPLDRGAAEPEPRRGSRVGVAT